MKFKHLLLTILLIVFTFGCANNNNEADEGDVSGVEIQEPASTIDVSHMIDPDRSLFYDETLTIGVLGDHDLRNFAFQYRFANPGVNIQIENYWDYFPNGLQNDDEIQNFLTQLKTQLMAGTAPILIDAGFIDYLDHREARYLIDWFPVINADPEFNEDEWFMNAFHAFSVDNKLYCFPSIFAYNVVTINNNVPGLREAVSGLSGISLSKLVDLHSKYDEDMSLLLTSTFGIGWIVEYGLDGFFDFESRWVDFNNEKFIEFISRLKKLEGTEPGMNVTYYNNVQELYLSERYLFNIVGIHNVQYFVDFETGPLFYEHIPLTNEQNELLIWNLDSFVLNAGSTPIEQALAWDFVKFMSDPRNSVSQQVPLQPTNKELFYFNANKMIPRMTTHLMQYGWELEISEEQSTQNAIALLESFGNMPMAIMSNVPRIIRAEIMTVLHQFNDGLLTAEQSAAEIQNRVELILMEMDS
jgi:ABC-type glycerol-3-phosphate transport system substrate-binding protein